ncbi:MAG: sulfatase [Acidobacteria bacterium]|nr:sulfatase [Acidobacteriota bacterium]
MITRRNFMAQAAAGLLQRSRERLNVVLILVDDMGATDLGCFGSSFYETPNIDRLATQGMRFTQAYSACTVCSPSRGAILTGKYPARLHLTDYIPGHTYPWARLKPPDWTMYLPLEERTLAEALKPDGYASASIGKWHLAPPSDDHRFYPDGQGFDFQLAGTYRGQPPTYFSPYRIPTLPDGPKGEYLTDRETSEAIRFIDSHRGNPFFLYLPHHTVHTPLQAKADYIAYFQEKARPDAPQNNPTYAGMIRSLDENVGRLMKFLDDSGLAKRTVVILTSDNGGWIPSTKTNLGLRAGKGSAYEGGVRVPMIVRWPGVVKPGSACDVPVIGIDIYPTVLDIIGEKPQSGQVLDGQSIVPLLKSPSSRDWKREALFWHYPHYHPGGATPYSAIRYGDWRLIEFYEDRHIELYDLKSDPEEKRNLAGERKDRVQEMKKRLDAWRRQVGAQDPLPNPDYDPARAQERKLPGAKRK